MIYVNIQVKNGKLPMFGFCIIVHLIMIRTTIAVYTGSIKVGKMYLNAKILQQETVQKTE